jgi:AraC-like DNA-binding protein
VTPLLQAWQHTCTEAAHSFVLPDGCQDLIGVQLPNEKPRWFIAPLSDQLYKVSSPTDQRYMGYRFMPGANFDAVQLLKQMDGANLDDNSICQAAIDNFVRIDPRVHDTLSALACEPNINAARQQLGVTERTLQRFITSATGRTASYWKCLARWRKVALMLADDKNTPLVQIAIDHGYFDQAHMNLEFRRWVGISPSSFQNSHSLCRLAREPGFGCMN